MTDAGWDLLNAFHNAARRDIGLDPVPVLRTTPEGMRFEAIDREVIDAWLAEDGLEPLRNRPAPAG